MTNEPQQPEAVNLQIDPLVDAILARVPEAFRGVMAQYGRDLIDMELDDFLREFDAQITAPILDRLDQMRPDELLAAGVDLNALWSQANRDNEQRIVQRKTLQRNFAVHLLNILAGVAAARIAPLPGL